MNTRTATRFLVVGLVAFLAPASLHASVVGHWALDDPVGTSGTGVVIDSENFRNGTTVGPPTFGGAGANANTGTSASFPGTSRINVPYNPNLNPASFTATAWAYANNTAGAQSVVTSRSESGGTKGYILYNINNRWEFWTGKGSGWDVLTGPAVTTGTWTHLAISRDAGAGTKTLYVNGVPNTAAGNYVPNTNQDLHIGSGGNAGTQFYFDGRIDDVVLFDEALTTAEVVDVRDNSVPDPIIPGPVPYPTILKPVAVSTSIGGDAGSHHVYLIDDNPTFAATSLQRPVGTGVTLETGDLLSDALATVHERSATAHAESWTRPTGLGQPQFVFDLTGSGDTPVESIILWQYGNSAPGNSARDFELIFHTEAEGGVFSFASAGGTETIEFAGTMSAAASYATASNVAQQFSFVAPETARYVGLRIANNYNGILSPGGDRYGLGEVRFVAPGSVIPEPATMAAIGLALSGLGGYLKKRRQG